MRSVPFTDSKRVYDILQVESVQLASESSQKQMEVEVANAKHNAAQAAAAHKSAAASWQGEMDWQKSEVSHACRQPYMGFVLSLPCLACRIKRGGSCMLEGSVMTPGNGLPEV